MIIRKILRIAEWIVILVILAIVGTSLAKFQIKNIMYNNAKVECELKSGNLVETPGGLFCFNKKVFK